MNTNGTRDVSIMALARAALVGGERLELPTSTV
jgi:hypothetical protein